MSEPAPIPPPDWSQDLAPGERLLWTGRPEPGRRYSRSDFGMSVLGGMVALFAALWILFAVTMLNDPAMAPQAPLLGLVMVFCGLVAALSLLAARWLLWGGWLRRERDLERAFYALTDRRALMRLTAPPPRFATPKLTSWPILSQTMIEMTGNPAREPVSLHLAMLVTVDSDGDKTYTRTGFERIADAEHVLQLILDIQAKITQARSRPETDHR
ncbi:hypothetical protein [Pseudogemmobacter bohemicus]|uniref:hypothetical protein n=1 Tax=Pseudogemmobacter bohemicus TaxID=2250708 RepID=UPI000DD46388|nr:hypothetical protein [Pseudogemmobacter bohemicus]